MEALTEIRKCKECGEKLLGRSDKKYCDDSCRSNANKGTRTQEAKKLPACVAVIQKALPNNYRILTYLNKRGKEFSKMYFEDLGFDFSYVTATALSNGEKCYVCFNQVYTVLENKILLLPKSSF